ncbi:MAG: methyltransferase domain-containing protein [Candidatus Eisenbacteria bacterium]|nr:methyltransferase domain-containing protein [Candidatus Eisenbacteria bacterium]
MKQLHRIQFPPGNPKHLNQDESYFFLCNGGEKRRIRLHDYDQLYSTPGLYEQVVCDRLKCGSPAKVATILDKAVAQARESVNELRVLDFGAGNGMVGEALQKYGVSRIVGVDIIPEAAEATERDRPAVYDAYYVADFTKLTKEEHEELKSWSLNALVTVAALGFGDIPVRAFIEAFNLIDEHGWVSFNIKESFLDHSDKTGFSKLIRELIFSEYLDLYHLERYRHRLSIAGEPLFYFALAGRKNAHVKEEFIERLELPS